MSEDWRGTTRGMDYVQNSAGTVRVWRADLLAERAAAAKAFEDWGLEFRPAETVAGSVSVSTDSRAVTSHGLTYTETRETLTCDTIKPGIRSTHRYQRRWMGGHWSAPVVLGETVTTI